MDYISVSFHNSDGLFNGIPVVKLNAQRSLGKLPVMVDADILDAHVMHGKEGSDGGYGSGLIGDIYGEYIFRLNRPA